jgi:hypothetical protein
MATTKAANNAKPKLTPRQRRVRRQNRNPLYDPSQQLSGHNLVRAANDLVALEYNPQRAALRTEARNVTRQGGALVNRAQGYYRRIAADEARTVDTARAVGNELQQRIGASGATTATAIDQAGQQAAQAGQQAANLTGVTLPDSAVAAELAAARTRAAGNTQTAADIGALNTSDYANLLALGATSTRARGVETQQQLLNGIANQQKDIRTRQTTLAGQRGAARSKAVTDLRQAAFDNLITQGGLNIKTSELRAQIADQRRDDRLKKQQQKEVARNNRRRARLTREQIATTQRGQDVSAATQRRGQDMSAQTQAANRQSRETIARANRQARGQQPTAAARQTITGIGNAFLDISTDPQFKTPTGRKITIGSGSNATTIRYAGRGPQGWEQLLRARGAPPLVIRAAVERATGGISPETARELRAQGVNVPRGWLRSRVARANPNIPDSS